MQIESLKYFVELARAGSFYKAAQNTFISQQGLNKAIRTLETELDTQLVVRTRRGIHLTRDGETFLAHAQSILAEFDLLLDDLVARPLAAGPQRKRLIVNVTYYGAQVLSSLAPEIDALQNCALVEKPFRQVLEDAETSDGTQLYLVDLYADTYSEIKSSRALGFDPLAVTQFGIVWQDGSPLASKESLHREELKGFPLAVDSHREILRYADFVYDAYPLDNIQQGVTNPRATLAYALTSPNVAASFDSFAFEVARRISALDMDRLHFTPLATPRAKGWFGFVFSTANKPNTRERHFIDTLREKLFAIFPDYYAEHPL